MTPSYWQAAKNYLIENDKVLAEVIQSYHGEALQRKNDGFHTLARAIVGQQISVKAADSVWARLEAACKIEPSSILSCDSSVLRLCGLSERKVAYIKNIAEFFAAHDGSWDGDDEQLIKQLCTIKGVGRWTAEMFLIFHLQRADILPLADIGLLKAVEKHYGVERTDAAAIAERWRPYRSVATWYLWRSLDPHVVEY